jgi:hypothetical protein
MNKALIARFTAIARSVFGTNVRWDGNQFVVSNSSAFGHWDSVVAFIHVDSFRQVAKLVNVTGDGDEVVETLPL